jgi:CheY-like chemotaxis protein
VAEQKKDPLVLLVDDDIQIVAMLRSDLESEGFRVAFATDGINGQKMALTLQPDLIISDVFMPGMDGLSMIEAIYDRPDMRKVPVIFLSGHAKDNYAPKPKNPAMRFVLVKKPVFLPEFNNLVHMLLS